MSLPERLSRVEVKTDDLVQEQLRIRRRLHELETDRATIRLLAGQVKQVVLSTEQVATVAAEKAVGLALDTRRQHRREDWGYRLKWVTAGAAVSGTGAALIVLFIH